MSTAVVGGFFVGLIYGLLAVGLVIVYRGSRVINFAYGESGMIAAFLFVELRVGSASPSAVEDRGIWFALPLAIAAAALLSMATERFVARPLRDAPRIRPLVGTFAVASLLLTFGVRRWGGSVRFAQPVVEGDGMRVAGLTVQPQQLLILGVSVIVLVALSALYRYSAFGVRLRATALDPFAAGLVGIDVNRTSMLTWALAGALAGLSAILIAPLVAFNVFFMTSLMLRGLAAALVGGLTSIGGAFTSGVLIGVVEAVIALESPVSGLTDATIAVFVLVLMLVRPSGLVRAAY